VLRQIGWPRAESGVEIGAGQMRYNGDRSGGEQSHGGLHGKGALRELAPHKAVETRANAHRRDREGACDHRRAHRSRPHSRARTTSRRMRM
jgi:hypothetical protein